jgi:hypothetical protein
MKLKFIPTIFLLLTVLPYSCMRTEGTVLLKGKVIDARTEVPIPSRTIIIQALIEKGDDQIPTEAGQTVTDSSGAFTYSLRLVKDAYTYNFSLVGDSDYAFRSENVDLGLLKGNSRFLSFSMKKLVDLTIKIYRRSTVPPLDTLYLSWESDGIPGKNLFAYTVENFAKADTYFGSPEDLRLNWVGGRVNSIVKTRVFSDKRTRIMWDLARSRKRRDYTDTITCRRDQTNIVSFVY